MKITITSIELRSPFKFFPLSLYAMRVVKQLNTTGNLAFKKSGFWKEHFTMTLWNSEDELKNFARSGAHLEAMKQSRKIAKEIRTLTVNGDKLPDWRTAKAMLREKGKIHRY